MRVVGISRVMLVALCTVMAESSNSAKPPSSYSVGSGPSPAQIISVYEKLLIAFAPNLGQADGSVQFLARGNEFAFYLTPGRAVLTLAALAPVQKNKVRREGRSTGATSSFYF